MGLPTNWTAVKNKNSVTAQWRRSVMKLWGGVLVTSPFLLLSFFPFSFFLPSRGSPLHLIQRCKLSSGSGQSQAVEHILMHFTFKKLSKVYTVYVLHTGTWVRVESSDWQNMGGSGPPPHRIAVTVTAVVVNNRRCCKQLNVYDIVVNGQLRITQIRRM